MRANSSGVRPCLAISSGVRAGSVIKRKVQAGPRWRWDPSWDRWRCGETGPAYSGMRSEAGSKYRPCLRYLAGAEGGEDRVKNHPAVGAAESGVAGSFGVGHEAEDIATGVTDARDIFCGAVGVGGVDGGSLGVGVAEEDATGSIEFGERGRIGGVTAFAVGDGDAEEFPCFGFVKKGVGDVFYADLEVFATKVEFAITNEGTWEEA